MTVLDLIAKWRNDAKAATHAGRRYEHQRSIAFARECYGQMAAYTHCADELEAALEAKPVECCPEKVVR